MVAVILQLSLFVIAIVAVNHRETRTSFSNEPEPWGLPCYVTGSFLLFVGMFLCSFAIEKSTVEYLWEPKEPINDSKNYLRLFWVQRSQRVSDQIFDSCVALGGSKDYILTSSRRTDVLDSEPRVSIEQQQRRELLFKGLTSVGALAGGVGFTVQFVGLRGLPWPCAVSQLGAIFAMAIIRALIRRRLGNVPPTCPALPEHELDFLAIQLEFNDSFRNLEPTGVTDATLKGQPPDKIPSLAVMTALDLQEIESPNPNTPYLALNTLGTSEQLVQLVRVRRRLGVICPWTNRASKPTSALANTIKMFMESFVQDTTRTVEWYIPMKIMNTSLRKLYDAKNIVPCVKLLIKRESSGWSVDSGDIEAVLSLWMASIQARRVKCSERGEYINWGRSQISHDSRVNYSRILGYKDDAVLVQDLEWWTPWTKDERGRSSTTDSPSMNIKLDVGFPKSPNGFERRYYSKDRPVDKIFHDNSPEEDLQVEASDELLTHNSSADLATICAQHLFTSFIWTVAEYKLTDPTTAERTAPNQNVANFLLPTDFLRRGEVDIHNYDKLQSTGPPSLKSSKTSGRGLKTSQKLSHTILTNLANYGEKEGLGTSGDIMLCMIPAFSFHDLLPNEIVLDQPPPTDILRKTRDDWIRLTPRYIKLLDQTQSLVSKDTKRFLALTAVVSTMEFIYLLGLDFSKPRIYPKDLENQQMNTEAGGKRPDGQTKDLDKQLDKLLNKIFEKFPNILEKLWPIYELQQRKKAFNDIFRGCSKVGNEADKFWGKTTRDESFLDRIGFGTWHKQICEQPKNDEESFANLTSKRSYDPKDFLVLTTQQTKTSLIKTFLGGRRCIMLLFIQI